MAKLSMQRRKEQLKEERKPSTPRNASPTRITFKGKVRLNKSGNMRGIHNQINPPSSEHMTEVRKKRGAMSKIFNRAMPVLQCSNCAFATSCPQYKAGFECAYLPMLNSHTIESETDLMNAMKNLCEASLSRVHRQAMMETLTGGMPSLETSEAFNIAFMQLNQLHTKMVEGDTAEVSIDTEDGTIIGRLFGGLDNLVDTTQEAHSHPVELAPQLTDTIDAQILAPSEDVNHELIKEHVKAELEVSTGQPTSHRNKVVDKEAKEIKVSTLKI